MARADVILAATDFDEASARAIDLARELAAKLSAELVLVHVCEPPAYAYAALDPSFLPTLQAEVTSKARESLHRLSESLGGVRAIVREGDAVDEILAVATELSPRFLVLGTHGRRGLEHLLLGSVAEHIVRQSPFPVLTVRAAPSRKA